MGKEDQGRAAVMSLFMMARHKRVVRRDTILESIETALSEGGISQRELLQVMRLIAIAQDKSDADLANLAFLLRGVDERLSLISALTILAEPEGGGSDGFH